MLRWNGWGYTGTTMELSRQGKALLGELAGPPLRNPNYPLEQLVTRVPESRLAPHPLVTTDPRERIFHSHGQSFPDWVALRFGTLSAFPDGVARPNCAEDVVNLLAYARSQNAVVIPFGGGTSVVGHLTPLSDGRPVLTISLARLNRLVSLDPVSNLACFEAGVAGPDIESQLAAHGFTLGHYPQSFELSTLGGWIVTRSSGQQSMYYGRMDHILAGAEVATPRGLWTLPSFPGSAAGPDLRQVLLGSEGRLGIVTRATVRVTRTPAREEFSGAFFPAWKNGVDCAQAMASARLGLSMIRLSNPKETVTNMALSGHDRQMSLLKHYLSVRGVPDREMCMLLFGITGDAASVALSRQAAHSFIKAHGGVVVGKTMGATWAKKRFLVPYLRNTLWDIGYAVDTLETSITWDRVTALMGKVEAAISSAAAEERE
ncbi:MAG: FAD-binding oxidoreductase, partial [Thermodesulfobacteriota bacterium]